MRKNSNKVSHVFLFKAKCQLLLFEDSSYLRVQFRIEIQRDCQVIQKLLALSY